MELPMDSILVFNLGLELVIQIDILGGLKMDIYIFWLV